MSKATAAVRPPAKEEIVTISPSLRESASVLRLLSVLAVLGRREREEVERGARRERKTTEGGSKGEVLRWVGDVAPPQLSIFLCLSDLKGSVDSDVAINHDLSL